MKFLIQKIDGSVRHDFTFTLLESIRYNNWYAGNIIMKYVFFNTHENQERFIFKPIHKNYIPIGSVQFVSAFLFQFYGKIPKPINVPEELYGYAGRSIFNGTQFDLEKIKGSFYIKNNDKIKGFSDAIVLDNNHIYKIPAGNYQISELIAIDSEWRVFVFQNEMVGLQHYSGDFTRFPDINKINGMIKNYKNAPVAYTLDVGINKTTFVIECHDFFSCGLYGFSNHKILPYMYQRWFSYYTKGIEYKKIHK